MGTADGQVRSRELVSSTLTRSLHKGNRMSDKRHQQKEEDIENLKYRVEQLESTIEEMQKWMDRLEQDTGFSRSSYID